MVHKASGAYNIEVLTSSKYPYINERLFSGNQLFGQGFFFFFFLLFLEHQGDTRNFSRIAVGVRRGEGGLVWTVYLVTFVIA